MNISREDVRGRDLATKLATTDFDRAAQVAYKIRHPWYRCQALAAVADGQPDKVQAMKLIGDAFRAANEQDEINRVVTVASWPLKVCVRLSPETAERKVRELLDAASKEPHTLRRGTALSAVLFAVKSSPSLKTQVLPSLVESLTLGHGWRIERIIADVALLVKEDQTQYLPRLLAAHRENGKKRKLLKELSVAASA